MVRGVRGSRSPTGRLWGTESLEGGGYNEVDPTYAYYMYQGRGMCNEVGGSRCSRFAQSHSSARWVECLVSGATRGTITYIRKIVDGSRFAIFLLLFSKKKVIIKIREGKKDLPYCTPPPLDTLSTEPTCGTARTANTANHLPHSTPLG